MSEQERTAERRFAPLLVFIFCLSGASALAYEVLWTRQLTLVLGGSALAVSTVLATFMGGLGFGSFIGGRFADRLRRPLLLYASVEAVIALFALSTPVLLSASGTIFLGLYRVFAGSPVLVTASRVLAAAVLLFIPSTFMGATLPLVARFFIRRIDRLGRGLGLLYGVNTLGGVIGSAFVGYYGILTFGVRASTYLAVAVNFAAVLGALIVSSRSAGLVVASKAKRAAEAARRDRAAGTDAGFRWVVMLGFGVSGFTAIGYEVLWTRALSFAIGSSVFAFTTVLAVFLTGLFIGAFVAGVLADKSRRPMRTLGFIQVMTGLLTLITFSQARNLPNLSQTLVEGLGAATLTGNIASKIVPAAAGLLLPTIVIGLTFPFILKVATERLEILGTRIGTCYAVNTIGSILGSLLAGFVLLPFLGVDRGVYILILCNLIMAHIFFQHARESAFTKTALRIVRVGFIVLLAFTILIKPKPYLLSTRSMRSQQREIIYHEEGQSATVSVVRNNDMTGREWGRSLYINLLWASDVNRSYDNRQYYAGLSLVPTALHSNPARVFVAGLASGATTGAAALDERTEKVTCVEISPEVVHAASYFAGYNYNAMRNDRIEVLRDDARAYLETTDETYDVIVTDCFISAITGTAALYSKEYFELCSRRLAPGGLMSVGAGFLMGTDRAIARTFIEAFPHVAVFAVETGNISHNAVFLIGANEPASFSAESIERAFAQPVLRRELTNYAIPTADKLIESYLCSGQEILPYLTDTEICTDDRPTIDFLAVAWVEGFAPEFVRVGKEDVWHIRDEMGGRRPFPFRDSQ